MILVLSIITLSLVNSYDEEDLGRCGGIHGACGGMLECCSKFGYCGVFDAHCHISKGCQPQFGECIEEQEHFDIINRPDLHFDNEDEVSTDGKCGPANGICPKGQCCSKEGECGTTDDHCLITRGCKSLFSNCTDDSDTFDDSKLPPEEIPENRGKNMSPDGRRIKRNTKNEKIIWDFLYEKFQNKYAVAGLMGCMYFHVKLNPSYMERWCLRELHMDEKTYTRKTDKGTYKYFTTDKCTYGLSFIWDEETKQKLLDFAKSKKKSIGDINVQIEFFWEEFTEELGLYHPDLIEKLKDIKSLEKAAIYLNHDFYTVTPVSSNKVVYQEVINNAAFYYNIYGNK